MTLNDLAGFQARELEPVCGDYRVWHICSMGPPSSGGVAIIQILGMLQARFPSFRSQTQFAQRDASFYPSQPLGLC